MRTLAIALVIACVATPAYARGGHALSGFHSESYGKTWRPDGMPPRYSRTYNPSTGTYKIWNPSLARVYRSKAPSPAGS